MWRRTSIFEGVLNARAHATAIRPWVGHVVCVAGDGGAEVLTDDVGTPRLRVLQ